MSISVTRTLSSSLELCVGGLLVGSWLFGCDVGQGGYPHKEVSDLAEPLPAMADSGAKASLSLPAGSQPGALQHEASQAENKKPIRLGFVGDMSFSLHVQSYLDGAAARPPIEAGYPLHGVADVLRSYDLLVGNLECVLSNKGEATKPMPLTCSLKALEVMLDAGFDLVSVANNHVQDMGEAGYYDMLQRLEKGGLAYSGHLVKPGQDPLVIRDVDGIKVAVIAHYHRDPRVALKDIKRAREGADLVIVFPHWGVDFIFAPVALQRRWAKRMVDAGADVIVGAHPHVVHEEEIINDKLVVYSLGNFVFSGMTQPGTDTGAILELDVTKAAGVVAHRYRKVTIDRRGAPHLEGEPTDKPPQPERGRPRFAGDAR